MSEQWGPDVNDAMNWAAEGLVKQLRDEITRLNERIAQYEVARCVMCGCEMASYHPDDIKKRKQRRDDIDKLRAKMARLWEENVRRAEAISNHRLAMERERIQSYYFDRDLWSVLGGTI